MKRTLSLLLLSLLLLAGCQAPPPDAPDADEPPEPLVSTELTVVSIPQTAETSSFFLSRWDGETHLQQFCYSRSDIAALAQALPDVQGYAVEGWTAPEDPWPIYGLQIGGVEEDFEAAYCGGVWLDSQGHVLQAEVDFPALWEQFAADPETSEAPPSAIRELALRDGSWDLRFLEASSAEPDSAVPMELAISENGLSWAITNQAGIEIVTGNSSIAAPQVLLDGTWYHIPILSGKHYGWNSVAIGTPNGDTLSGTFWQEPYGQLPDGDYRLVLHWSADNGRSGMASAPFRIENGAFLPAEA